MAYTSIYKYDKRTKVEMLALSDMSVGDNCFCTDWNTEAIYNGEFWLASNMVVLKNNAGVTVTEDEVLVASTALNDAVVRSSTQDNIFVIGTVVYSAATNANVVLQTRGLTRCKANTLISRAAYINTDSANGYAYAPPTVVSGVFGLACQAVTGGTASFNVVMTNRREYL